MQAKPRISESSKLQCRIVVERAFRELRERGVAEALAYDSVTTVYRLYHPEVSEREARFKIAEWLE